MTFQNLLKIAPSDPEQQQRLAELRFPDVISAHGMRLWRPGDKYAKTGERYLLGVATYSLYDLQLLDELAARIREGNLVS